MGLVCFCSSSPPQWVASPSPPEFQPWVCCLPKPAVILETSPLPHGSIFLEIWTTSTVLLLENHAGTFKFHKEPLMRAASGSASGHCLLKRNFVGIRRRWISSHGCLTDEKLRLRKVRGLSSSHSSVRQDLNLGFLILNNNSNNHNNNSWKGTSSSSVQAMF